MIQKELIYIQGVCYHLIRSKNVFLTGSNVVYRGLKTDFVVVVVVVVLLLLCPTMLKILSNFVMFDDVSLLEGLQKGL